ncbi:hypothetical protein ABPG74_000562 [Tetrahymena malaccensis]
MKISEEKKRLFKVLLPYVIELMLGSLFIAIMMIYYYQFSLKNQLKGFLLQRYYEYLAFISFSEKIFLTLQYQKITMLNQKMGILTKQMMSDTQNFEDLVAWDDKVRERYSIGYNKPNFLIQSSLELQDFCKSRLLCGNDQVCLNKYTVFPLQFNYMNDQVQYEKAQYSTYQYPLSVGWQNLTTSQKEYVIKMDLNRIFIQTLVINSSPEDVILPSLIYSVKEQDGIFYQIFSMNFLTLFPQINNQDYGGPFKCDLVNGKYQQYKYTNVNQFSGFQYQDAFGVPCGNATNQCTECSYYNQKRIFPFEWRCRPWYLNSKDQFFVSFGQPYINLNPTTVGQTITFKVVLPNENIKSIQEEYSYKQDAVVATDIDLNPILDRYKQNENVNIEYSYLISTNPSSNSTQYSPLVIAHPLMNLVSKPYMMLNLLTLKIENKSSINLLIRHPFQMTPQQFTQIVLIK